ncbi:MAG: hypothetical protein KGL19_11180 [Bacteroidota bacterium]|nr:hypothetical protein [Bacteroidota bacterium]
MNLFKNILLPVNKGMDVSVAVKKALELKDEKARVCIHFLMYEHKNYLHNFFNYFNRKRATSSNNYNKLFEESFYRLKKEIAEQCENCVAVIDIIPQKNITKGFIKYINENGIDLFLFCQRRVKHRLGFTKKINFDRIARQSSTSVLSITPGCLNHSVKSIILPVGSFIPEKKIQIAIAFAQKYNGLIHLITMLDNADENHSKMKVDIFYKTYKILQECGYTPQYKILSKYESHEILLRYAENVNADLILLNPVKKNFLPTISVNAIVDFISPHSHLQVLMTKPNIAS